MTGTLLGATSIRFSNFASGPDQAWLSGEGEIERGENLKPWHAHFVLNTARELFRRKSYHAGKGEKGKKTCGSGVDIFWVYTSRRFKLGVRRQTTYLVERNYTS